MKNGKKLKLIGLMLTAVVMMTALSACSTFDSFNHTFINKGKDNAQKTIYIGVFEPKTGKYKAKGLSEIKGIELANSIYGRVKGYEVKLIEVDTQSTSTTAATAIESLIKMKPVAIIGSEGEATSLIASNYIEKAGIPTITPTATNPLITQTSRYYFRACITESQRGAGVAEYVYSELNSRHIGIVKMKNDTTASALIDGFNDNIKQLAGKKSSVVSFEDEIGFKSGEINKVVKKIYANNIDTVYLPVSGAETMDRFFTRMEKAGLTNVTYIGDKSWGNDDFTTMLDKHPNIKAVFPYETVFSRGKHSSDLITKEAEKFKIQYASKYGNDDIPDDNAALGYDAYLILINAIHNSASLEGADIRSSMLGLKGLKCATGDFTFDETGSTIRGVNIAAIRKGKIVSVFVSGDTENKNIQSLDE